ncbi:MAG: endonuclease domain-containing protein [Chloroflexota bacterium]
MGQLDSLRVRRSAAGKEQPAPRDPRLSPGRSGAERVTTHERIPVTSPTRTLIDQATRLPPKKLERAVNEADKLGRVRADALYASLGSYAGQPGVAGLSTPETKAWVNGYEVDFFWPDLRIVVETDGLRYHRTASQQRRGLERDQAHLTAGMWPLRFSHWQVKHDPTHVRDVLRRTAARARAAIDKSRL